MESKVVLLKEKATSGLFFKTHEEVMEQVLGIDRGEVLTLRFNTEMEMKRWRMNFYKFCSTYVVGRCRWIVRNPVGTNNLQIILPAAPVFVKSLPK